MRVFCFIFSLLLHLSTLGQSDTTNNWLFLDTVDLGPIITQFSGKKGKWILSGHTEKTDDDILIHKSLYLWMPRDSSIFFTEKKWFHPTGEIKRSVSYNFKKRRRAKIIDQTFSPSGKRLSRTIKKTRRHPTEIRIEQLQWKIKE